MSGGMGAVSAGISETIVEVAILILLLLLALGAWKLLKLLIVVLKG